MPDPRRSKRFLHKVQSKQPGMTRALKGCCSALFRRTFTRNCLDTKQLELLSQELQRDYFDTSMFADHPAAPRCGSSDRSTCRRSQSPFGLPSRSPAPPLRESECSAARPRTEFAGGGVTPRPLRRRSPRCTAARSKKTARAGVGTNKLLKYWPPALTEWPTKGVRDAFFSSPQLPRLLDADAKGASRLNRGRDDRGTARELATIDESPCLTVTFDRNRAVLVRSSNRYVGITEHRHYTTIRMSVSVASHAYHGKLRIDRLEPLLVQSVLAAVTGHLEDRTVRIQGARNVL